MAVFFIVNAIFIAIFVKLVIDQPPLWVWGVFIVVWTVADTIFARKIHLAWWYWMLLIIALFVIDLVVLKVMGVIDFDLAYIQAVIQTFLRP